MRDRNICAIFLAVSFASFLVLSGCDENGGEEKDTSRAERTDATIVTVKDGEGAVRTEEISEDRIVAGSIRMKDGKTYDIPVTELFPGDVYVRPDMQNPYAGDPEAVAAGRRHFAAFNCSGCHAPLGGGGMGPALSDDKWIYGSAPAQIYLTIMQGRPNGMPAWGAMLPKKVVWELTAYVETLSEIDHPAQREGFLNNEGKYEDVGAAR